MKTSLDPEYETLKQMYRDTYDAHVTTTLVSQENSRRARLAEAQLMVALEVLTYLTFVIGDERAEVALEKIKALEEGLK